MRWSALALILIAGCSTPAPQDDPVAAPEPDVVVDAWEGRDRILVAGMDAPVGSGMEFDVLCLFGGTAFFELPGDESAPDDTVAFEFEVTSEATTTGVQAGYSTGSGITWLDVVVADAQTFRVETDDPSWTFHYQLNVAVPQDCYTGASLGGYAIIVHALRQ